VNQIVPDREALVEEDADGIIGGNETIGVVGPRSVNGRTELVYFPLDGGKPMELNLREVGGG